MSKKKRRWPQLPEQLPLPVTDNHTHLPVGEWEIPRADGVKLSLEDQLQRAAQVGIHRLITVGCEIPDFDPTLEIARRHRDQPVRVRAALALHPNEAPLHAGVDTPSPDGLQPRIKDHHCDLDAALAQLEERLDDPLIVAVGETGVDKFRTAEDGIDAQKRSFAAHLELARGRDLPVQIHDRDAHEECLEVLYHAGADRFDTPVVFHCFSGGPDLAEHCTRNGWYGSFSGTVTFPANEDIRRALLELPRTQVLVETDAPYLTPVPERGHPNASYVMAHTVRFIAKLWQVPVEDAIRQLEENALRVYGDW
ncbi:MAG: TatD family hydrolase [Actinomycetaceae bacterium]|nr:TatD family hydrolase [Actinomycetaceae bacterium]